MADSKKETLLEFYNRVSKYLETNDGIDGKIQEISDKIDLIGLEDFVTSQDLDKIKNDTQHQLDISKKNYDTAIANIQKETNQSISDLTEQTHEAIINIRSETNSAIADSKKYLDTQIAIIQGRVTRLEDGLFNDITANPFTITFDNLNGINLIVGVYNASNKQIEC